eukprot:3306534-Prymnesium_polylepis.2
MAGLGTGRGHPDGQTAHERPVECAARLCSSAVTPEATGRAAHSRGRSWAVGRWFRSVPTLRRPLARRGRAGCHPH